MHEQRKWNQNPGQGQGWKLNGLTELGKYASKVVQNVVKKTGLHNCPIMVQILLSCGLFEALSLSEPRACAHTHQCMHSHSPSFYPQPSPLGGFKGDKPVISAAHKF